MSSEQNQASGGQIPIPPPVEVSPAELVETARRAATTGGSPVVGDAHETPLTTPSGLLKTDIAPAVIEDGNSHTVRLALLIAATLLAAGALLSFMTLGH